MNFTRHVDPFLGNGEIDLPEPSGIAASWFFIKAQTGNTHPGACSPFGMVSACPYSGAYVTGYGLNAPNSHARPPRHLDEYSASGFTHFHPSGTGAVGVYGNYFRVTPLAGDLRQLGTRWPLEGESARPGYYATILAGTGIRAELTVSPKAAFHRYTFPVSNQPRIAVDFSVGGLDFADRRTIPARAAAEIVSPTAAQGHVLMEGIPVYVYIETDFIPQSRHPFTDGDELRDRSHLELDDRRKDSLDKPFGVIFNAPPGIDKPLCLRLGFSFRSVEQARRNVDELRGRTFDQVAADLQHTWNDHLSRVQIDGGTDAQRQIFYSALYHSLIKPADCSGESPFWSDDRPFFVDFATMWDQYKTLLPFILSVYPERGADALNAQLALAEHLGEFPIGILLSAAFFRFENQARALGLHFVADAFNRQLPGVDYRRALRLAVADLRKERNRDFREQGVAQPFTHNLDLADACACVARIAAHLKEKEIHREFSTLARQWKNAYDPATGRLGESHYYEGGPWNYSFRLLHDMAGRIALYPSAADFVADLDRFFGYGQPPVVQPEVPGDGEYMRWGFSLNRFEGFNNEPDIEVPYAYLYAGRPDRTAEIVRAGMQYMFTTGRGGLPGNDDSGGLSSWYVWNALGIFPVTGQPLYLIGSPLFASATIQFGANTLRIDAIDNSPANIYVQSARLNGEPLDRAYLSIDEVHQGGQLELTMGPAPSSWATDSRPPSFPT